MNNMDVFIYGGKIMNGEKLKQTYYDIVRNYIRDDAIFDEEYQELYPKEYQETKDTYAWFNNFLREKMFPFMKLNGAIAIENGVTINNCDYKFIDTLTKKDYDKINNYFEELGMSFWKDIPDIKECLDNFVHVYEINVTNFESQFSDTQESQNEKEQEILNAQENDEPEL